MEFEKGEVLETLHIPTLRRKWQILVLQVVSTLSLLLLLKKMNEVYGTCSEQFIIDHNVDSWCPAYEHTRGLMWLSNRGDLLIPDLLLGVSNTGTMSLVGPLLMCVAAAFAMDRFWASSQEFQTRFNQGAIAIFIAWMVVPFVFSWVVSMVYNGLEWPTEHLGKLFSPFDLVFELVFLGIVFAPVLAGLVGIWGLSKRPITWAVGYFIVVIAFHSVLTFEPLVSEVDVGLRALPTQIGEGTMFGGLVSPLASSLLGIAVLMLVFLESGSAAINHLEYAASLPEDCKRDPEYVRQFNNVVNAHLLQMGIVITLVLITTALALAFDDLMISIVGILEGTQWTGQVKESLELQMTYGKVISAGLFILVVAGTRFIIPWQSISGYIESGIARLRV
ncbi:MAG: hypothetical protein VYD41_03765 [Candidatus Thermoplasmatota archaeon]|nr:hypothetical protein [Candidatus Thermoplasmatota archaeon]